MCQVICVPMTNWLWSWCVPLCCLLAALAQDRSKPDFYCSKPAPSQGPATVPQYGELISDVGYANWGNRRQKAANRTGCISMRRRHCPKDAPEIDRNVFVVHYFLKDGGAEAICKSDKVPAERVLATFEDARAVVSQIHKVRNGPFDSTRYRCGLHKAACDPRFQHYVRVPEWVAEPGPESWPHWCV